MGYHTSNAAYAYDMRPQTHAGYAPAPTPAENARPRLENARPRLDVVAGAGREASQDVSPQFTHCVKVFAVLAVLFVALGLFRVTLAGLTTSTLNSAATLSNELTEEQEQSSDLEVMRAVYGSSTRIRDLAEGYGMVAAESGVTLDFTEYTDSSVSADAGASPALGE